MLFVSRLPNTSKMCWQLSLPSNQNFSNLCPKSRYSTAHGNPRKEIAVLGGGITGLATTYYLAEENPDANITLYERSSRAGGWMSSKHIKVGDETVIFEQGPRTIRPRPLPQALVTLDLVRIASYLRLLELIYMYSV
jgi:hypothetical protein